MVGPAPEGSSADNRPEFSGPGPSTGSDSELNQSAPPAARAIARSASQYLRDLFSGIIEHVLADKVHVYEPDVHDHITLVMMANLRSNNLEEVLQLDERQMRSTEHRFRAAHQFTLIFECCQSMERSQSMSAELSDLYVALGDQVLFMQGMFQPRNAHKFIDLNNTRLPKGIETMNDVGRYAYERASRLVAGSSQDTLAERRYHVLDFLKDHVAECVKGLRYVRQELDALPYELKTFKQLLLFDDGKKVA